MLDFFYEILLTILIIYIFVLVGILTLYIGVCCIVLYVAKSNRPKQQALLFQSAISMPYSPIELVFQSLLLQQRFLEKRRIYLDQKNRGYYAEYSPHNEVFIYRSDNPIKMSNNNFQIILSYLLPNNYLPPPTLHRDLQFLIYE